MSTIKANINAVVVNAIAAADKVVEMHFVNKHVPMRSHLYCRWQSPTTGQTTRTQTDTDRREPHRDRRPQLGLSGLLRLDGQGSLRSRGIQLRSTAS